MFEEYLEDSHVLYQDALINTDERTSRRLFRAAVFYGFSAIEAFVNFIGETIEIGGKNPAYEIAFLNDKKFGLKEGEFQILNQSEYHRIEDKLKYIIKRYCPKYNIEIEPSWSQFVEFKRFRDSIMHPRDNGNDITRSEFSKKLLSGLNAIIQIISIICKGFIGKPLRKKILDLVST